MALTIPDDKTTPWLEPGVGEYADKARESHGMRGTEAEIMAAAAAMSAAITFKRLVDMLDPFAQVALAHVKAETQKKGKG